jgi:hypothetical protein
MVLFFESCLEKYFLRRSRSKRLLTTRGCVQMRGMAVASSCNNQCRICHMTLRDSKTKNSSLRHAVGPTRKCQTPRLVCPGSPAQRRKLKPQSLRWWEEARPRLVSSDVLKFHRLTTCDFFPADPIALGSELARRVFRASATRGRTESWSSPDTRASIGDDFTGKLKLNSSLTFHDFDPIDFNVAGVCENPALSLGCIAYNSAAGRLAPLEV